MSLPPLDHDFWMAQALMLAHRSAEAGEVPVAAIIVHHAEGSSPRAIGLGHNERETHHDPSGHAEIVAMRAAGRELGHWRLTNCTLYVTLEPCAMCAGALVQARVSRLVYGARDPKAGAVESLYQICSDVRLNHRLEIVADVMGKESSRLLQNFFGVRRRDQKNRAAAED